MKSLKSLFEQQMNITCDYNKDIYSLLKRFKKILISSPAIEQALSTFEVYIYQEYDDFSLIEEVLAIIQESYEDAQSTQQDLLSKGN